MKKFVSFILALSMLLGMMTPVMYAYEDLADIAGDYIDKTANGLNEADQTDVTLTVPGTVEGYIDVVFILGGGMTANMETIESAINVFKPAMESGKATVRMGLISLEKGKEIILDLNSDEAILDPDTYVDFVTEKFDSINDLPNGTTNLHSQMLEAQKMLAQETKAKAENKYVFVLATGRTYWFDDANGEQATIVNKIKGTDNETYYYWGNYLWQSQRGGHSSLYMIPASYNNSYEKFFADIEKWVAADGNKYEYSPHFDKNDYSAYVNWEQVNNKDLKALGVAGSRYGNGIVNPKPTAGNFITGTMAAIGSGSNPQQALNYERAQYESVQVWKQLIGSGYNCYAICSESPNYQNGSVNIKSKGYTGSSTIQVGHAFMDYLAELAGHGKAPVVWDYQRDENGKVVFYPGKEGNYNYAYTTIRENFFESVREDMLHTCSTGSTVVDYIGKNENGNFEFIENANYIKLVVGGVEYITTVATTAKHIDKNGEEAKSSYAFTAPGADGPTFWLDYFYGDGKTTERFVWTFGESVSVERIASLTYKLQLTEKIEEAGRYTVPTNNSATLYPVDSDGNPGDPVLFPVPEVEYIVLPDEEYNGPDNYDKSKTATDLYDDRYTDVTLSIPGEVEDLATDIVFVVDKSSSDKLSSDFANGLFEQLMAVKRSSGARINVGVVIFNYKAHKQIDLVELNENNYQNLLDSLPTLSGGTNADAGLTIAKKMLDAHDDVDASRKHVIFISDGLSWVFEKDGVQYTVLNKKQSGNSWVNLYGVGTQPYLSLRAGESWKIPKQFGTWDAFWSNIKTLVENDRAAGDKWLFEMTNHRGEDPTKPKPSELINTEAALAVSVPNTEIDKHALNVERALYETWESYEALQSAGYNCNSYYTGEADRIGEHFMQMLAGSSSMKFEDIKHDILYSVSKGSKVIDYIGYSNDSEEGYNFDFIDKIGEEFKLPVLKVGSAVYFTKKLATSANGATASYAFSATENGEATFFMDYYRGNGTTEEHFVWTINENVSRFAPVSLTYTLDLVERSEIPGLHVDVDTNQIAVLYPKDSDGNDGPPEEFEKPKVEYFVDPVEVTVTKIWDDDGNRDMKRPSSITINLLADGVEIDEAIVTADKNGEWKYTFANLREFKDGVKIVYTITEDAVEGYTTTINGYTITNTYTPETTKVSGNKTWNDNNNQDGIRPESITINLLANGEEIDEVKVTADKNGNWTYSFENLPKYENGKVIVYTITEDAVEGYTTTINGFNVTNTHTPEITSVSGTKTWKDNNNQDGVRPDSITINLLANGEFVKSVKVTAESNWKYSFENLPKYENGEAIVYTITEDAVEGYTTTINGFNVTNTHTPEITSVSGTKTWKDNNNQDGVRPNSITINLYADGKFVKSVEVTAEINWKYSFNNLPKYENGKAIVYTITEDAVEGYTTTINGFDVTNTHTPEITSVSGNKIWNDANNQDGKRPASITINLLANGKEVAEVKVTAASDWTYSFENLPKYENGKVIVYTITEDAVEGYTTTINGFNVTNTYTPETTFVSGGKTWNDANNQDGKRPASITINLLANGKEVAEVKVTAASDWTYSFENLPKYENGNVIVYTITEDAVEGYTTTINGFNVTNTYAPEQTNVSGTKTWKDNNDQDGIRPDSITINLYADGELVKSVKVTAESNWIYSFENLPKYENGKVIVYTITEDAVEGYTTTYDGYNVTNTHVAGTAITLEGIKYLDGEVAEGFTFILVDANGNVIGTVVSGADGKFAFAQIDYTEEGTYVYFVKEVAGEDEEIVYDASVYTVTVNVTKDGEALKASIAVEKDEASYEGVIEFNNETLVEIPDNPPPLDDIPETGDNTVVNVMIIVSMIVALAVTTKSKFRRFE